MEDVSDYMAVVIDDNGNVDYLGQDFNFSFHDECLIDYAKNKYPKVSLFKNIDYMDQPLAIIYYLTKLRNVVFTNVSVDDEKRGMLYMPDGLTDEQIKSLNDLMSRVLDFKIYVEHDLVYDDMVMSSEMVLNSMSELNEFCIKRKTR